MKITIPIPTHAQLHGGGFEAGFFHPVLGFDHLLAMVAVGIISTLIGGWAIYLVPLAFVSVMFMGSVFGYYHLAFIYDEMGISISLILLGLFIAYGKKTSLLWAMLFVAFFAFFHGHAHGVEIPKVSSVPLYMSGFVLATTLLHVAGVGIGLISKKLQNGKVIISHLGSAIMGIGFYILYELII